MKQLLSCAVLLAVTLHGEPRTFTDQFGRTVKADIVSVEGDQVSIRREDGQLFTLAASKLTEEDQRFIRNWVAAQPASAKPAPDEKPPLDPTKLVLNLSRAKFGSRTLARYSDYTHKHEDWGYSIQLTNQHARPLENLRIEYNLFARTFADTSSPKLITGSKSIKAIPSRNSETFRTRTAEVCKERDSYFGINSQGELRGLWYRIYVDGQLLIEQSSPESLMSDEKWTKVKGD